MNIVQICVAEFFVCVILGLDPRIQVCDVASEREHRHCSLEMPTPRCFAPPLWPEGNFISFPLRGKFSSSGPRKIVKFCGWFHGGVPRSGEVVFCFIQHCGFSRPPRPSGHPSTGGELSLSPNKKPPVGRLGYSHAFSVH